MAKKAGSRQGSKVAAVETVGRGVEEEDFALAKRATASPARECATSPVGRARDCCTATVDRYLGTPAADAGPSRRRDMFEKGRPERQVSPAVKPGSDRRRGFDGNEITGRRGARFNPVEAEGNARARVPDQAWTRRLPDNRGEEGGEERRRCERRGEIAAMQGGPLRR